MDGMENGMMLTEIYKNNKWATKKPSYFPFHWLFDRDPYNGSL